MRFVYDIIYFTFFEMLFNNIVSGLMLDAFSSLREEADSLDNDKKNKCYICDISRESLEKQGFDFDDHTRNKHFLWNYIFYIYVLEQKDETDYTGLEYYIRQQYYRSDEEMEVKFNSVVEGLLHIFEIEVLYIFHIKLVFVGRIKRML